jgi:hypothetical protein
MIFMHEVFYTDYIILVRLHFLIYKYSLVIKSEILFRLS